MNDHNHNKNGNLNNPFPNPTAHNDSQLQNNSQPHQNHPHPHHRNYVERVVDYKFIPVMPMNINQPGYNNPQPGFVQQPNPYYQTVNGFQQPQQPLLQQFIVPPNSPSGSDFNNYQFQPAFFEPPFSSMPFENFYPNTNMLNPMDFNFNNNQNNFMPPFPNPTVDNQDANFNNYNANNNEVMYNNQPVYQQPYQQPVAAQNVNQPNIQQGLINNQLNENIGKYEQQASNPHNTYNQSNNSKDSELFDEKLTNLEEKIVKLKNKLSEVDLFEDEIADDNKQIEQVTKKSNQLKENQEQSTAKVKATKKRKIKKALIVTTLFVLFIGIAVGTYFGYTLFLKDILINKLGWKWLT